LIDIHVCTLYGCFGPKFAKLSTHAQGRLRSPFNDILFRFNQVAKFSDIGLKSWAYCADVFCGRGRQIFDPIFTPRALRS